MRVVVAGAGAAGVFAAIACAEKAPGTEVVVLEKSPAPLAKVGLSGGGRCNVTHACFDPKRFASFYPRGGRELLGAFHRFQASDMVAWLRDRGVDLKTESDGRMFPVTDDSATITGCLLREAKKAGVRIETGAGLAGAEALPGGGFRVHLQKDGHITCDRLLLATGGNQATRGYDFAAALGHTIVPPVPSLFTFEIDDPRLAGLSGLSVPDAVADVVDTDLHQRGPLLVTHWGLSGPAILKLSAWGARVLHDCNYVFDVRINWCAAIKRVDLIAAFAAQRGSSPGRTIGKQGMAGLPQRLWESLLAPSGVRGEDRWGALSNKSLEAMAEAVQAARFRVTGRSIFKEEFVTCGGVSLKEVDFRTMESRIQKGLFFAGELLDIDGVTGGFNLQAAWTTGWIAGHAMAAGVAS